MRTKEEVEKDIEPLRAELYEIEEAERYIEQGKLLGRCFKYRNRYNSENSWWLYCIVTKRTTSHWPECFMFQEDYQGKIDIETKNYFMSESWTEITRADFNREWNKIKKKINSHKIKIGK